MFLPTNRLSPAGAGPQFLGWMGEVMDSWGWIENMRDWDFCWISLFNRVARKNVGHIDWEPYLPWLFTKFLAAFQLPVGSEGAPRARELFHQISLVSPPFFARALWQIALPPLGGVAAICHRPLGERSGIPKK
jgi:hypothetical protein